MSKIEVKHTPGPWEWDSNVCDYDPEQEAPWLVSSENSAVPDMAILKGVITCDSEANARLIAASPELLEALVHCIDWLNAAGIAETMPVQQQARAAIFKAAGVKND